MGKTIIGGCLGAVLAACGSGSSQTGAIGSCGGITLSGSGAFKPFSGMTYQNAADLGGGQSAPGTYEVVIWANSGDAGSTPSQSNQLICMDLLGGAFASTTIYVAPQTLEFSLPYPLSAGSYQTTIADFTQPYSESSIALEDIVGSTTVSDIGTQCLSGSFSANLVPVDPTTGFAIDGGGMAQISGTFDLPYCG